jgi:hypothetical protein
MITAADEDAIAALSSAAWRPGVRQDARLRIRA